MSRDSKKPILIIGAYGRGNLGDDVFISCAVSMFKDNQIYINSADDKLLPEHVRKNVRTLSTTNASDWFKKIHTFFRMSEVTYWGGDFWVELHGARFPRQLLYKMIILNLLFRLTGKQVNYVGCGIGQLKGYSLILAKISANLANNITLRERRSAKLLNVSVTNVYPDIAVNLPYNMLTLHKSRKDKALSVVVSVLWWIPEPNENFETFTDNIASALNSIQNKNINVTILPMQVSKSQENDDLMASESLMKKLNISSVSIFQSRELESVIDLLKEADLVIGTRLHANILAILNGTPTIGLSYRPKVHAFFEEVGLSDYCLDYDELEKLPVIVANILDTYDHTSKRFYRAGQKYTERRISYEKPISTINRP